ncbi:uncharacterized protein I303_101708 [Kwoniella dejecticola CBS 10117]|uniref:Uncharacterized protein n=1 Tax=Kwoniella dejecticola CBS 10117 TaxID=1296121 RepID=A0AAJ8KK64_9TREE
MAAVTDLNCEYALRAVYFHVKSETTVLSPDVKTQSSAPQRVQPTSFRKSHDGSFFPSFDLTSFVGKDSSRSPKYPEKLFKTLDGYLQRIAMGQEPKYSGQRFRRTAARFWSSTWADKAFQRQMKESRKIEELILAFVTTSTRTLQKDEDLPDGAWKSELSSQVSLFLELLYDCLSGLGPLSSELAARLQTYRNRLESQKAPSVVAKFSDDARTEAHDSVYPSIFQKYGRDWWKGSILDCVRALYAWHDDAMDAKLHELEKVCTEQAALDDLKTCLKLLNTESSYPYSPTDFNDSSQWTSWRSGEISSLSQLMLQMMQSNPALLRTTDRQSPVDIALQVEALNLDSSASNFTFIPAASKEAYRDLLKRCLDRDLETLKTLPEDEDVSLSILSPSHVSLLQICAARWRLPLSFRSVSFFSAIIDRYQNGDVPAACVHEAMAILDRAQMETPLHQWATSDRDTLDRSARQRDLCMFQAVESALDHPSGYHSPDFVEAVEDWLILDVDITDNYRNELRQAEDRINELVKSQAFNAYIDQASRLLDLEGAKTCQFARQLALWIEKEAKRLDKKFTGPISRHVDLVPLVLQQNLTLWFRDLEDTVSITHSALSPQSIDLEDSFALYRVAYKMSDMGAAFLKDANHSLRFPLSPLFTNVIDLWLDQMTQKTKEWSDQALAIDTFEATAANGPSSSVTDLFDSFRSAVQFLMDLRWPDERQLAVFATRLAKIISISIGDYCTKMERLFSEDMRTSDILITGAKQKAWVEKAKATFASLQGDRKIQAFFDFTPQSCVKLNNIESARQQLDELYDQLRVDDLSAYDVHETSTLPDEQVYLFTVKIVLAEGLALEGNTKLPDSFVIVSDEHGNRFAKTRTIHDDSDPRWDESFDIPVKGNSWFMATVRHRNLAGKHNLIGRAYLRLDPSQHVDLVSKDVLLPLDTRGHLLLRMTPVLRHTLSRASIKTVFKPAANGTLDYNEALVKLSAAYRSAIGSVEYGIPPTKDERSRGPTDASIESAIHPLFDYLDTNNHTLASSLSPDAMQMVMAKLWKQILMTIEALIVPPLSDKPSRMRALNDSELDIALKWLKFLRDFFYVGGDTSGVPLSILQNAKFNEILSVRIYYDWNTDDLMEECIRGFQSTLKDRARRPTKSVMSQRNLGTIRARKSAKRALPSSSSNSEMIMRILRMRQGTQEFLAQQLQTISVVKLENPKKGRSTISRPR